MLSYLRGKRTSKIVLGFVGVIMLAFAFAGIEFRSGGLPGFGGGNGDEDLVTIGGDLEPSTVINAYRCGIFPMEASQMPGVLAWWSR